MEKDSQKNSSSNRASLRMLRKANTRKCVFKILMKGLEALYTILKIVELIKDFFKQP